MQIQTLFTSQIHTEGLQVRAETNRAHVSDLVELIGDEGVWPAALPPCVVFHDSGHYYLADGHHRLMAAQEAGCTEIPCEVRQGTRNDALWRALGSNADHGLKRTPADRRNAILTAYRLNPQLSNRAIGKACKLSESLVRYHLAQIKNTEPPASAQFAQCEVDEPDTQLSESDSGNEEPSVIRPDEDWSYDAEPSRECSPSLAHPATSTPSTIPASTAASSPEPDLPAPDIRTDARGRQLDVSRIGKGRKSAPRGVDELGVPIPSEASAKAFESLDFFVELDSWAAQGAKLFDRLGKMPGAELLRAHYLKLKTTASNGKTVEHLYSHDLENLRRELQHWRPFAAICPSCKGEPKPSCKVCQGLPYVIRAAFERCPEQLQEAVRAKASRAEPLPNAG